MCLDIGEMRCQPLGHGRVLPFRTLRPPTGRVQTPHDYPRALGRNKPTTNRYWDAPRARPTRCRPHFSSRSRRGAGSPAQHGAARTWIAVLRRGGVYRARPNGYTENNIVGARDQPRASKQESATVCQLQRRPRRRPRTAVGSYAGYSASAGRAGCCLPCLLSLEWSARSRLRYCRIARTALDFRRKFLGQRR